VIKRIFFIVAIILSLPCIGRSNLPKIQIEYSYALDLLCPNSVVPEVLTSSQLKLIEKIPEYRNELLGKINWFQSEWDLQGQPLLAQAISIIGKPFPMIEIQASLFLCPRFPSMGTPLAINVVSYLNSSARMIDGLSGNPLPVFFFVSTTFHEILHKYVNNILRKSPSVILAKLNGTDLYKNHLHLFALQKLVFESMHLAHRLPQVQQVEAMHGSDYVRAWNAVHENPTLYEALVAELKF